MCINDKRLYKKLVEMGYVHEPRYNLWLSRDYWKPFDAAFIFNGIDPHIRIAAEAYGNQTSMETKKVKEANFFEGLKYGDFPVSKGDRENFANFLVTVFEEREVIETWRVFPDPLILINTYLQKIGNIPNRMFKLAKRYFLELYQKRDRDEKTREYWNNNWHNNIAKPFLKLITDKDKKPDQILSNKNPINQYSAISEKMILEESAEARAIRIRNRGHEIYKLFREQYPNKKITKWLIAEQIMKEEEPLYKLISTTIPCKKQPALATYIKEIRKMR